VVDEVEEAIELSLAKVMVKGPAVEVPAPLVRAARR
jgi:hypothetical protein